jgi:hypothetical protein
MPTSKIVEKKTMSELTTCNYCSLQGIKRRAREDALRVVLLPARRVDKYFLGGWDVFRFPRSMWTAKQFKALKPGAQRNWWVCWFMELTDHCVC